jgi:hypothetical protein
MSREKILVSRDEGFQIRYTLTPISSYNDFWLTLVDTQRSRGRDKPIKVFAMHANDFSIWDNHPLTARLLRLHENFHSGGGQVTRIICRRGETDRATVKICERMRQHNVEVHYYDIDKHAVEFHFGWDFLYVEGLQALTSVIWDSSREQAGQEIDSAIYLNSFYHSDGHNTNRPLNLVELWNAIKLEAEEFKPQGNIDAVQVGA